MTAITEALRPRDTLARAQRSALLVLAVRVFGAALAYGTQVLLARLMGKPEYGVFATVWVWITILGHGSLWGVGQSVCRFVPHHKARGEAALVRGFIRGGAIFALASSLATVGLLGLALWLGSDWIGEPYRAPFAMALLVVPLFAIQDYAEGIARSLNRTGLAIAPPYLLRQALIAGGMGLAMAFGAPAEPAVAVAAALGAVTVSLAVQAALLIPVLRRELPRAQRDYRVREWVRASLPMAFVEWTSTGLAFSDVLLVSLFLPPAEVAVYFAATRILQFVIFTQYAASAATAPRFAEARARADAETLAALIARTARLTCLATLIGGACVLAAAPLLLGLFGPGFSASVPALAILIAGVVAKCLFGPAEDLLNMLGAERLCALISFGALAVFVAIGFVLIPAFGLAGAASAMGIVTAGRGAALSIAARSRLGVSTHVFAKASPGE